MQDIKPNAGTPQGRCANSKKPPSLRAAKNAIAVTDGIITAGWLIESDGQHYAFDHCGRCTGLFPTRAEAVCSLPYLDLLEGAEA
jgi:hypothetical protein